MSGLLRADWIRLGRRRSLQAIVLAIPLLAATFFLLSFRSTDINYYFDETTERQNLTDQFTQSGMPPDQVKLQVDQTIADELGNYQQMAAQEEATRAQYAFPASAITLMGSALALYFFGMILLTATTLGDEFGWGTIRTTLLASSNRPRLLAVRLGGLVTVAAIGLVSLFVLSAVLPLLIAAVVGHLPPSPPVDAAALVALFGGTLLAAAALIGFAAAATLIVRSGSLTLVIALVYVLAETTVLALLARLEPFKPENSFGQGNPAGPLAWVLNLFPVHAIQTFQVTVDQVARGGFDTSGGVPAPQLSDAAVPLLGIVAWAAIFIGIAFVRFDRMDIAE